IKHDCASILEFRKIGNAFVNKIGEVVELEETYVFPLLKGSDVAQGRVQTTDRYALVTQKFVGESTEEIREIAPKTWQYLESHIDEFNSRKSKIYQNSPKFSIFGVGSYTFAPWKIAICGLYKRLEFKLVGSILGKPAVFDDTVYLLSFEDQQAALKLYSFLSSPSAIEFYSSLIFWDEKRPIKSTILNSLDLEALLEMNHVDTSHASKLRH
ncbi:SAM-dependent methyltransferase, partial [Pseudanabaenaceae cyanobacterium LEGE 13415]|nr:SAM-dependent methyltransferase [Pseudanabaenaceae cyanobacterium LEGE 13415]